MGTHRILFQGANAGMQKVDHLFLVTLKTPVFTVTTNAQNTLQHFQGASALKTFHFLKGAPAFVEWGRQCHDTMASSSLACVFYTFCRLSVRGLTYNNNAGQLAIEYLRPDATSQFSKRTYPTVGQLRQHVASQVHRETTLPSPDCEALVTARRRHCPNPKPDRIPTFTGAVSYVYNDVAKVLFVMISHY